MPVLTLIGGPNGSGKSSLSEWIELNRQGLLVDPDAVAKQINPTNPREAALEAGRKVLEIIAEHLDRRESFGVETTLSSHASLRLIDDGHADEDVRRRYYRSIANLHRAIPTVDLARVYDNSGNRPRLLLSALNGVVTQHYEELPDWVYTRRP